MHRRAFIGTVAASVLTAPLGGWAQTAKKTPRVALVFIAVPVANMAGTEPTNQLARAFVHGRTVRVRVRNARARAPARVLVGDSAANYAHPRLIADFAARQKIPALYNRREFVDAGGLMSYGANFSDQMQRAAVPCTRSSRAQNLATCRSSRRRSSSW